jgi:hypothetical protein
MKYKIYRKYIQYYIFFVSIVYDGTSHRVMLVTASLNQNPDSYIPEAAIDRKLPRAILDQMELINSRFRPTRSA